VKSVINDSFTAIIIMTVMLLVLQLLL